MDKEHTSQDRPINYFDELYERHEIEHDPIPYVGFWRRFFAYLIDLVVVSSLQRIFLFPIKSLFGEPSVLIILVEVIVLLAYFILMNYFTQGQTLGKIICKIRVVQLDGYPLDLGDIVIREGAMRYILYTFPVIYVMAAFTDKKQHLGDFFADTVVIPSD